MKTPSSPDKTQQLHSRSLLQSFRTSFAKDLRLEALNRTWERGQKARHKTSAHVPVYWKESTNLTITWGSGVYYSRGVFIVCVWRPGCWLPVRSVAPLLRYLCWRPWLCFRRCFAQRPSLQHTRSLSGEILSGTNRLFHFLPCTVTLPPSKCFFCCFCF